MRCTLIFTPEGPRSIDERGVIAVYPDKPDGSLYCSTTLCMASGAQAILTSALDELVARLNDYEPPPLAA